MDRNGHPAHRQPDGRVMHHSHTSQQYAHLPVLTRKESDPERPPSTSNPRKRPRPEDDPEPTRFILPSGDRNEWYTPGYRHSSDEEELAPGTSTGNWGQKHRKAARFVRKGKMAAWGPAREEYDIEERARTRLRHILPEFTGQELPKDPILPHLRSPSPPLVGPYIPPSLHQASFTASVFDPNVSGSFRSQLLPSLDRSAYELLQSEVALGRAFGRFWAVLTDVEARAERDTRHAQRPVESAATSAYSEFPPMPADPHDLPEGSKVVTSRLFTQRATMHIDLMVPGGPSQLIAVPPNQQMELSLRSINVLRELQEDSRECVERLEEIMDTIGKVKQLRDSVWTAMRARAIEEIEAERQEEDGA